MNQYSAFSALWESFYSKNFYNHVADFWRGRTLVLNAILTLLYTIIVISGAHFLFQTMKTSENLKHVVEQIPVIKIDQGIATTPEARLYPILDEHQHPVIIIDTTSTEIPESINEETHFYLNKTKVIVRKNETETRIYDLKSIGTLEITPAKVTGWIHFIANWGALILSPFLFIAVFIWRLIETIIFSLLALLFLKSKGMGLDYGGTFSLTMAAMTPAFLMGTFIELFIQLPFMVYTGLFMFITVLYIYFSVHSLTESNHQPQ